MIWEETARYTSKRGGRKMAWGQSRYAVFAGIALLTPNSL